MNKNEMNLPPGWVAVPGLSKVVAPDGKTVEVELTEDIECEVVSSVIHKKEEKK